MVNQDETMFGISAADLIPIRSFGQREIIRTSGVKGDCGLCLAKSTTLVLEQIRRGENESPRQPSSWRQLLLFWEAFYTSPCASLLRSNLDQRCFNMREEWIKLIKENMVLVSGSKSTYRFDDKEPRSVAIDFGALDLRGAPGKKNPSSSLESARRQKNITLDLSDESYLIVNRTPSLMRCRQLIPWKRIVDIAFQNDLSPLPPTADEKASASTRH
jgi:hypothetical protein